MDFYGLFMDAKIKSLSLKRENKLLIFCCTITQCLVDRYTSLLLSKLIRRLNCKHTFENVMKRKNILMTKIFVSYLMF